MKKILILSTIFGHQSISDSIKEILENQDYKCKTIIEENWLSHLYQFFYQKCPLLYSTAYKFAKISYKSKIFQTIVKNTFQLSNSDLESQIIAYNPDLIITAYLGTLPVLEKLSKNNQYQFINIITNPRNVVPSLEISQQAKANLVFDQKLIKDLDLQQCIPAGWPVKTAFYSDCNKTKIKQKLNLENKLTFLINSGYSGKESLIKLLAYLIKKNVDLQIVFSTGKNKTLLQKVTSLAQNNTSAVSIIPLDFTKKMHEYMHAADLVIGKAGPNTIFEAVATHTPFFATDHIPGQEDGNLDLIHEFNIGYVEENVKLAQEQILALAQKPQQLQQFQPYLKKLAAYNQQFAEKLIKSIQS